MLPSKKHRRKETKTKNDPQEMKRSSSYTGREALAHFAAFDTFHTAFATLFTQETATKGGQAKGEMRISTMYEQIPEEDRGLTRHQGSRDFFSPAAAAAVAADIPSVVQLLACRPERRSGGVTYGSLRCVLSGRRTLRRVTTVLLGRVAALRRTVVTGLLVTHDDRYLWAERLSHRSVWTDRIKLQMMESVEEEN
ncbi:hypothetical protein BDV40DRAFT_130409 [Aspergillus tamarii]|uniref:Uncharacterized protein n=1 Tax=Aspergillus tamarii TaxID=41984 RepID=A0A5N6VAC3_ASPTM|nr:hypothetical protein BDV40DRAFT_130409 [Aspergillus tamarii]